MPRSEARLKVAIWQDADFLELPSAAQRLYMLLLSQGDISLCGVLALSERRWASKAPDTTAEDVRVALKALEDARFVLVDEDTEEVMIRSFIKNDGVLNTIKVRQGMWTAYNAIHSDELRRSVITQVPPDHLEEAVERLWLDPSYTPPDTPTDTPIREGRDRASSGVATDSGYSDSSSDTDSYTDRAGAREDPQVVDIANRAYRHAQGGSA